MRQEIVFRKIVQGGEELAFGQVTRGSEDDHYARIGGFVCFGH